MGRGNARPGLRALPLSIMWGCNYTLRDSQISEHLDHYHLQWIWKSCNIHTADTTGAQNTGTRRHSIQTLLAFED